MKRFSVLFAIVCSLALGFAAYTSVHASSFVLGSEDGDAVISKDQTVEGNAYLGGTRVVVEGTVKGDIFCAGETIEIRGSVEGDVFCAGSSVTVSGSVDGSLRVAGSDVALNGKVTRSVMAAGSTITTNEDFNVQRDFTAAGESLKLDGMFGRDVLVTGSSLQLLGTVARDVSADVGSIDTTNDAKIAGNLWYKSENKSEIADGTVAGSTRYEKAVADESSSDISSVLLGMLMIIVLAVVSVLIAPRYIHSAASLSPRDTLLAFLIGFVTLCLLPILSIIMLVTGIGALVGLVFGITWLLLLVMSMVFVSYYAGTLVLRKRATNAVLVAFVGSLVLSILFLIPFINAIVIIFTICAGIGMQMMHIKYQFSKKPYSIE